jgi:hypothetical protein
MPDPVCVEKSRNQKWVFEKNGLVKGKIRLNMPVFEAYGMTVYKKPFPQVLKLEPAQISCYFSG